MPTAILGDRACGKTTFLALTYAAAINYSNEPKYKGTFKYTAEPSVVNFMGDLYNQLIGGEWPEATMKGQMTKLSFIFGYKKMGIKEMITKGDWTYYDPVKFTVYDVAGEDVNDLISTPDGVVSEDIPEEVKNLLESRILVILIDASRIAAKPRSKPHMDMLEYDKKMATLISIIGKYNSRKPDPKERKIYPVFVLTKFDTLDPNILEQMSQRDSPPSAMDYKKRREYAETIMRNYFGQTLGLIKGSSLVDVSFDDAVYFFSSIETEFNEDGLPVPKLRKMAKGPGHELDFSYEEYVGFIERFRKIANSMPDDVKKLQEFSMTEP